MSSKWREGGSVGEPEIRRVGDCLEVQTVKAIYCETVDLCPQDRERAAARLGEIFAADVRADYGQGVLNGCQAVIGFLIEAIVANNESMWHSLHTPRIVVSGDIAKAQWTVMVRMRRRGSSESEMIYGRYSDELRRTPQGWLISSVRFIQEA